LFKGFCCRLRDAQSIQAGAAFQPPEHDKSISPRFANFIFDSPIG
jgi:hypothetical protein